MQMDNAVGGDDVALFQPSTDEGSNSVDDLLPMAIVGQGLVVEELNDIGTRQNSALYRAYIAGEARTKAWIDLVADCPSSGLAISSSNAVVRRCA